MPDKAMPVIVTTIGDQRDQAVGDRVVKFLTDHGYQILNRRTYLTILPLPHHPFAVTVNADHYEVLVVPRAR
jgi:hypothetical protein